jgi:hypothetical protein
MRLDQSPEPFIFFMRRLKAATSCTQMWKTIPALVQLRGEIATYLAETIEKGNENDYVTLKYLVKTFMDTHPSAKGHHPDQIIAAIKDQVGKLVTIVFTNGNPDIGVCMSCGKPDKHGYRDAFQNVKLQNHTMCPYNYGCGCDHM